jgi:glucokinase
MNALAIDIGGSHAACAVVRDGAILASRSLPADGRETLSSLLPMLSTTLRELLQCVEVDRADCAAFVLGFCGIVSVREKRVLATNDKFEDATSLDLNGWCAKEFGLPFLIENDTRLALLGEYAFGAARETQDVVMVTLGSGIGGAALLGGRLLESKHGLAGTIGGHLPVVLDGRLCSCGNRGCAESEASTAFLGEIYRDQAGGVRGALSNNETIGFAELFAAADAGDKPAVAALAHCLHVWSVLTVALIHAYDPEVVVFGGSVLKRAAYILPRLQEYVEAHAWTPDRTVSLRAASLGRDAALLGAIPLIDLSH